MSCGVYKITNLINNKVYIGQSVNIERRWGQEKARQSNTYLYHAFCYYGLDNFKFEILEILPREKAILDEREIYYINLYNSFNSEFGYNLTKGGGGALGFKLSEETKQKLREIHSGKNSAWYGKKHTEETKKKMSEAAKKLDRSYFKGAGNPFYNKHHTEETRQKMRESNKKRPKESYARHNAIGNPSCETPVYCVELDKVFNSIAVAARTLNLKDTHISRVCRGKRKTTGGYHWQYIS